MSPRPKIRVFWKFYCSGRNLRFTQTLIPGGSEVSGPPTQNVKPLALSGVAWKIQAKDTRNILWNETRQNWFYKLMRCVCWCMQTKSNSKLLLVDVKKMTYNLFMQMWPQKESLLSDVCFTETFYCKIRLSNYLLTF